MKAIKFSDLWKSYPNESPCDKKTFSNQCSIKVGAALAKCGVNTISLAPKNRHCWLHKEAEGHVLSATDLATGLRTVKIPGISAPIEIEAMNFKAKIAGKKGIIYFEDYWLRPEDRPEKPTGDHIDLWNGSRLTEASSWLRVQLGISYEGVWSDLEKAKKIIFWRIEE